MEGSSLVYLCKEFGLEIGIFGLCVYMVVTVVNKMAASIEKQNQRADRFMDRVRIEHEHSQEQHKNMMAEHKNLSDQHVGMIETLGRINGYKQSQD